MRLGSLPNMRHQQTPAILVVEDDFLIRMNAVDIFQDAGFLVYEAGNAEEAIQALEQRRDIRLLFTDVNMPCSMDGLDLARYAFKRWPSVALIVTSGRQSFRSADLPPRSLFIAKPYRASQILHEMRQMIGDEALLG